MRFRATVMLAAALGVAACSDTAKPVVEAPPSPSANPTVAFTSPC